MMRTTGRCVAIALAAITVTTVPAATILVNTNITTSQTWTASNTYVLGLPVYVTNGATLTIEAGTVIRGEGPSGAGTNDPGTLIIARGSKIRALGTPQSPIVFTDLNDNNIGLNPGTPPYNNALNALGITGQWGGVILLGRSYVANNTLAGPSALREFQIEGLTAAGGVGLYGNCAAVHGDPPSPLSICDDDDSGTMSYVSIRYGGFNLSANNEINGLTLGAVGRNTDLHHIEVFQNKDDLIEFFGGAASVKYLVGANGGDDGIDFDEGWRGKVQFAFVMQGTPGTDKSDKGSEQDGGNAPDGSQPRAIPTIYNATILGLGQKAFTNRSLNTALHFRDNAGGRWYNSFFADFGGAPLCIEGGTASTGGTCASAHTSGQRTSAAYTPDGLLYQGASGGFELELQNNQFWCFGNGGGVPVGDATAFGCDADKVHCDPGVFTLAGLGNSYLSCASPNPIRAMSRTSSGDPNTPDPITSVDPLPAAGSPLLSSPRTAPSDGFFEPVAFKGAFPPNQNWARDWTHMDRLGYFPAKPQVLVSSNITTSTTWTANNDYVLDLPVYVTSGATLTIEPCTVVRGQGPSGAGTNDPGTLIIARGAKIQAVGTPECPITFTDLNDDNVGGNPGTPPYDSVANALSLTGRWGGVILLGRSYVANNTLSGPSAAREFQIEGLTAAGGLGLYGNCAAVHGDPPSPVSICDDDDSGTLRYVSIRYGGFNVSANNEINGLTLGGVGRATDIDHIDIYQNKDDMIEFFGGAASVKYLSGVAGGDDGLDFDEGWRGKVQFAFFVQGTPGTDKSDKGSEQDGGNSPDGSQPRAIPTIYNATLVGLGQKAFTNRALNTALHFRDNAGGRWYNSFFADFGGAPLCIEGGTASTGGTCTSANTSGQRASTAYLPDGFLYQAPASSFELELQDNNFWCFGNGGGVPVGDATAFGCDADKVHCDPGVFSLAALDNAYAGCAAALPIRNLARVNSGDPNTPDPVTSIDPRAATGSVNNTTNRVPPADGFFTAASFKGAFRGSNWLRGWSTPARLGMFPTCDEDADAVPDELEGLRFLGKDVMSWKPPVGVKLRQDVLRSTSASSFGSATCVETDDFDATAADATVPAVGQVFFYLLRAEDTCGDGTLGYQSNGNERSAVSCGL